MSSDSSSGTQTKRTRTRVLVGEVAQRAHHRREPALHVVGAAPVQAVALDARRELLRLAGHDVQVAVEDQRRRRGARADVGGQHRQLAEDAVVDVDLARLEPALDEPRARADARPAETCRT